MTDNVQKKLAAVMFTYLVEYDDYLKKDESHAIKVLNEHKKILKDNITPYRGKIIKHLDNMSFVEFFSATDAVNSAIKIHLKFKKENSQNPSTFQMNLKIGIHMGEVYEKNNDLFGEGVNLAARVQALAKPGGTVTTHAIYNSIRSEENIFVRNMGRVQLKNIKEPERVFKIYTSKGEYNKENREDLKAKLVKANVNLVGRKIEFKKEFSIGITYIKNLGSEENEFFCYGITQDLILETSKISKIKVSQIDQILKYKDTDLDVEQIAKQLNAEYILCGNIMKMGDNFRLSLQFHNTNKTAVLWSETWEGNNDSLKDIKGKILYKLLDTLNIGIPESLKKILKKEKQISPEAYEYYVKAKYLSSTSKNKVDIEIVQDLYKKCITLDPNYIEPRYKYALELVKINELDKAMSVLNDGLIVAKKNKDDPGIAGINNIYGIIHKSWGRYEQAIQYFEKALELRVREKNLQDEAIVLNGLAQCFAALNNNDKAFECYNRSIDIKKSLDDKQGVGNSLSNLSMNYRRIGDYAKAIEYSKEAIEYFNVVDNPTSEFRTKMQLGIYQVIIGYTQEAKNNLKEALDFMLQIDDYKSAGMTYRYLGLIELNEQVWVKAQNYFIKALNYHQKAENRPAFEATTLFLGLSYYYGNSYELAEKFIKKAVQITARRTNVSFYGKTARAADMMLQTKIGKYKEKDVDILIAEIEKDIESEFGESGWIKREYWYISQSYKNLGIDKKAKKYRKIAYKHLLEISKFISDEQIKNDYINLPTLHKLMKGGKIESEDLKVKKKVEEKVDNTKDKNSKIFLFCPSCGFNNENKFKFCPSCGLSLES